MLFSFRNEILGRLEYFGWKTCLYVGQLEFLSWYCWVWVPWVWRTGASSGRPSPMIIIVGHDRSAVIEWWRSLFWSNFIPSYPIRLRPSVMSLDGIGTRHFFLFRMPKNSWNGYVIALSIVPHTWRFLGSLVSLCRLIQRSNQKPKSLGWLMDELR